MCVCCEPALMTLQSEQLWASAFLEDKRRKQKQGPVASEVTGHSSEIMVSEVWSAEPRETKIKDEILIISLL